MRTWVSLEVVTGHRRKTSEELLVKESPSELLQTAETPSQVTLVPSIQRSSHACLWGGIFCCCFFFFHLERSAYFRVLNDFLCLLEIQAF